MSLVKTTVTNISGEEQYFGYLPPHGVTLADGESYEVLGNIEDKLKNDREREAFKNDFNAGVIDADTEINDVSSSSST